MSAMNSDNRGLSCDINVTPMIDVLLVLLIIFMVIVPAVPRGEAAMVPHPSLNSPSDDAVVLEVLKDTGGSMQFRINQQLVAQGDLPSRLAAVYSNRAHRALFVKGDDQLSFTQIAEVIDIGHKAGANQIGIMTPKVLAGQ